MGANRRQAFKAKLLANPTQVLKEHGLPAPAGKTFRVIEEGGSEICLILHQLPAGALSETELRDIAAAQDCGPSVEICPS